MIRLYFLLELLILPDNSEHESANLPLSSDIALQYVSECRNMHLPPEPPKKVVSSGFLCDVTFIT